MARPRPKTRRRPRSNPRGVLKVAKAGYGFVQTAEGEFFVPASKMGGAFDGDEVELARSRSELQTKRDGRGPRSMARKPSARVVKVISRAHETLIGRYEIVEAFGIVVPEDTKIPYDILTIRNEAPHVLDGDIVKVRIVNYPTRNTAAMGVVEEVLGHEGDSGLDVELIIARHKLETVFSEASLDQAKKAKVDQSAALGAGYKDIQDRTVFTIDPEDARDFDDALSLDRVEGSLRLGVHIADVSYYVPWGSSIDLDARRRATSVYLVDRAIPMLPEELSNDICSLRPHEVRRAVSVDMYLNKKGEVTRYDIFPSLIKSSQRFTYVEVSSTLELMEQKGTEAFCTVSQGFEDKQERACGSCESIEEKLYQLNILAHQLSAARMKAGGIDFDTKEARVLLDEKGAAQSIELRERNDATSIVEEAMILANIVIAKHLHKRDFPCMYRVHEAPADSDLADLVPILHEFKYLKHLELARFITGDPFCVQEVLRLSKGKPESELISSLILRSMQRAVYSPHCADHYGLASHEYAHFTSPIRRYPDLVVHRMLKAQIGTKSETFEQQVNSLEWLAEHSSKMERIAEAAGRESQEMKIVELMQAEVGNVFDAVVAGVASYGLFVRLENTAEGLVPIRMLGEEYFMLDAKAHTLTGQESGMKYRLGQKVRVLLDGAYPRQARLDFHLV